MKKIMLLFVVIFMLFGVNQVQEVNKTKEVHVWTKEDSKAYARDSVLAWADKQYICLASLWGRESAWEHEAYNPQKVMGKNAGGIPQILGMSPTTPPTMQIDRGISYIQHRYITPCKAWAFHKENGWY
jgi:hypothetical protein